MYWKYWAQKGFIRPSVRPARDDFVHSVWDVLQFPKMTIAKTNRLAWRMSKTPSRVDTFFGQCQHLSCNLLREFINFQPLSCSLLGKFVEFQPLSCNLLGKFFKFQPLSCNSLTKFVKCQPLSCNLLCKFIKCQPLSCNLLDKSV